MKVLLVIPGPLGERMSAPEVRGWNMALELRRRHEVMIAAPAAEPTTREGIQLIPSERRLLSRTARSADVVIAPRVPPYLYATLASQPTLLVADMYNPAEVEQAHEGNGIESRIHLDLIRTNDSLQLRFADIVLCAVDAQRRRLAEQIQRFAEHDRGCPLLRVVPFGIDNEPPPPRTRSPIRERFSSIAHDDTVVLWWGNVWRWFDATTALRAFAEVSQDDPTVKLVLTGGRPPRSEASKMDETEAARELARSLGLLGKSVFFFDEWIAHADRHEYLQEADLGLTLHRDTPEKEVAARGRYMDYLWARLPCILGHGDELADRFAEGGFASTVRPGDIAGGVAALRRFIRDPQVRESARAAADPLLEEFRWSAAVAPLMQALDEVAGSEPVRSGRRSALTAQLARVYVRRTALATVGLVHPCVSR
jgi:glycosyltransferase involved in cell wall biosynthesis